MEPEILSKLGDGVTSMPKSQLCEQLLRAVMWLTSETCRWSPSRRLEALATTIQLHDSATSGAIDEQVPLASQQLIFGCLCRLVALLRRPDVAGSRSTERLLYACLSRLRSALRKLVRAFFPERWSELIVQIVGTLSKHGDDMVRAEACLHGLTVVFSAFVKYSRGQTRAHRQLFDAVVPTLQAIAERLIEQAEPSDQAMRVHGLIFALVASGNHCQACDYMWQSWSTMRPWCDQIVRLIGNRALLARAAADADAIDSEAGDVKAHQRSAPLLLLYKALAALHGLSRWLSGQRKCDGAKPIRVQLTKEMGAALMEHLFEAFRQHAAVPATSSQILATYGELARAKCKQLRGLLDPYVPRLLTQCLVPALKMSGRRAREKVAQECDGSDVMSQADWRRQSAQDLIGVWTSQRQRQMRQPFLRFLDHSLTQCAERLAANGDDEEAALSLEALVAAFEGCTFLRQGQFNTTVKDFFVRHFLPQMHSRHAFVQLALLQLCRGFVGMFAELDLPCTFLSALLFALESTDDKASLPGHLKVAFVQMIELVMDEPSCQDVIRDSSAIIVDFVVGLLAAHSSLTAVESACKIVSSDWGAHNFHRLDDLARALVSCLAAYQSHYNDDNDDDDDASPMLLLEILGALNYLAGHWMEGHPGPHPAPPDWMVIVQPLFDAVLLGDDALDYRDETLVLLQLRCTICPNYPDNARVITGLLERAADLQLYDIDDTVALYFDMDGLLPEHKSACLAALLRMVDDHLRLPGAEQIMPMFFWMIGSPSINDQLADFFAAALPRIVDLLSPSSNRRGSLVPQLFTEVLLSTPAIVDAFFAYHAGQGRSRAATLELWQPQQYSDAGAKYYQKAMRALARCLQLFKDEPDCLTVVLATSATIVQAYDNRPTDDIDDDDDDDGGALDFEDSPDDEDEDDDNDDVEPSTASIERALTQLARQGDDDDGGAGYLNLDDICDRDESDPDSRDALLEAVRAPAVQSVLRRLDESVRQALE